MAIKIAVNFESDGLELTGLTPVVDMLKRLDTESDVIPLPSVNEISNGFYSFSFNGSDGITYIGKMDGGVAITTPSNRYKYIKERVDNVQEEIFCMPVYDADNDVLTMMCYLLREGKIVTDNIQQVIVSMYTSNHTPRFEVNTTNIINGVAVLTRSTPNISTGESYYFVIEFILPTDSVKTNEMFKVLD